MTGVGAFGDGVTGGSVDGEPYDTRVDLDGRILTWSLYATDTMAIGHELARDAVGPVQSRVHSATAIAFSPAAGPVRSTATRRSRGSIRPPA